MRFDRLTERAQDGAMRAYELTKRYGHSQVDVEHLFLALLEQPKGLIPELLGYLSVSVDTMRERLMDNLKQIPLPTGTIPHLQEKAVVVVTPRFKRMIDQAAEEARLLEDEYVSTEHLLLAILSERPGFSANLLREARVTHHMVLSAIEQDRSRQKSSSPQAENRYRTIEKDPVTEDHSAPVSVEPSADKPPDYLDQHRQLLLAFRSATAVRSKAEADADTRYKAEHQAAEADHQRVHESAKAQRTAAENAAQAKRKSEEMTAETSFSRAQQMAATKLDEIAKAQKSAQESLAWMGQTSLLNTTAGITPGLGAGEKPADKLTHSAETATKAANALGELAQALYQEGQKEGQARQRRRALLYAGIAIIFVGVVSVLVSYMFRREEERNRATAAAQATAVPLTATAQANVTLEVATAQAKARLEVATAQAKATREAAFGQANATLMAVTAQAAAAQATATSQAGTAQAIATFQAAAVQATATAQAAAEYSMLAGLKKQTGMDMVYVPSGEFIMGADRGDGNASSDEMPSHKVYLDAFWIDQTEVTKAQYLLCVDAGRCMPARCDGTGQPDHPVVCVSWQDAEAFCTWTGKRLPTEAEWEKAARSSDARRYPWGNETPDCSRLNYWGTNRGCKGATSRVGSFSNNESPYGALDMAGNVWEWVSDWYKETYYKNEPVQNPAGPETGYYRVLRGGSWNTDETSVRVTARGRNTPNVTNDSWGFRCAYSP